MAGERLDDQLTIDRSEQMRHWITHQEQLLLLERL